MYAWITAISVFLKFALTKVFYKNCLSIIYKSRKVRNRGSGWGVGTWISLEGRNSIDFLGGLEPGHGGEWKDQVVRGGGDDTLGRCGERQLEKGTFEGQYGNLAQKKLPVI